MFNERSKVLLGQVAYLLNTLSRDRKRHPTRGQDHKNASNLSKHRGGGVWGWGAGAHFSEDYRKQKQICDVAFIVLKNADFLELMPLPQLMQPSSIPTKIYRLECNLERLLEETASSGGMTISPSTNTTDQSL